MKDQNKSKEKVSNQENEENKVVEASNWEPGERGYMFGFNTIDVGNWGSSDFKAGEASFGVVCVKIIQRAIVVNEDPKKNGIIYLVNFLDAKGKQAMNPKTGQPLAFNVLEDELFKKAADIKTVIEEKIVGAVKNAKILLNNGIIDAESAYKRSSPITN